MLIMRLHSKPPSQGSMSVIGMLQQVIGLVGQRPLSEMPGDRSMWQENPADCGVSTGVLHSSRLGSSCEDFHFRTTDPSLWGVRA